MLRFTKDHLRLRAGDLEPSAKISNDRTKALVSLY